ncbi:flagellar filament capping protein FliD [Ammoniphilus resinae]|uniref:Flagellar hook-associated protein 2 n=1 Tax=Ammoniphilus resinae TaxID=861532 RepID=A0ABS4GNR4_9BACL|nr:flagellar filament capping protein FliD [Ammoniphilus resinae]MBP1931510.1 flagellar hook-associated protein 2 [Ammoniphilus resinae]
MINELRFSGLASGMDTESIVKKLMDAERIPLNKLKQDRQWKDWQRDAYRETNTLLMDLRSSMEKLRLQSSFTQTKVSSSDTSKVDVTKVGKPSLDSYTISSASFAKPAQPSSVKFASTGLSPDDLINKNGGTDFTFKLLNTDGTESEIKVDADVDTVNSVISRINSLSDKTGVTASYSEGDKRLIFTSTATGASADFAVTTADGNNPLKIVKGSIKESLSDSTGTTITKFDVLKQDGTSDANAVVIGKDLEPGTVVINGTTVSTTGNSFVYDGLKFTLKAEMVSGTGSVTINKETDTEAIYNDIKTFVDKYNELIETLNGKLDEKRYRNYQPLLEDQKESMKDKEIELWEEKAKSGLLRNDNIISNALVKLRSSLYNVVSGAANDKFDTLSEIGIKPSDEWRDNGKLVINEDKLKEAITNNIESVKEFFTKTYDTGDKSDTTVNNSTKYQNSGVAWRFYDQLNASIKDITDKAGLAGATETTSLMGKAIGEIDDRIDAFQNRLIEVENRYWRQFTAMEKAIQKANSQSGWMMQQFGGGM